MSTSRKHRSGSKALFEACELLEQRRLLCGGHYNFDNFKVDFPEEYAQIHQEPDANPVRTPNSADIVWTNRGSSGDNFTSVFGANAETAREVIDAVLAHYERVITSFNHFNDVNVINVTISMNSGGVDHGGSASNYGSNAAGQPTSGSIVLDRGTDLTGDGKGDGGGYFVDPTPYDYAEFNGIITNAFAVDAPVGSAARGNYDLYTLVALELTHVLGINSSSNLFNSRAHYENTNIHDVAEGGGVGQFWVYDSPLIKHLMTSNNGGPSGTDRGQPVHGAGANTPLDHNGLEWEGAEDSMNAIYEHSRRYLVPETSRLIMQDGLLYTTVPAQTFGTAYTVLNQTNRTLTVRGAAGVSDDTITVDFVNNKIVVTVDVPVDFPGTWTAPGGGDFPAWRSEFAAIDFDTITINAGDGNDTIRVLGTHPLQTTIVNGGNGNDFIVVGDGVIDGGINSQVSVFGQNGVDTLSYNDAFDDAGNDSYLITSNTVQKASNFTRATYSSDTEGVSVIGSTTSNTFDFLSAWPSVSYTLFGLGGNDTFNMTPQSAAAIDVQGGVGTNTLRVNDSTSAAVANYTINNGNLIRSNVTNITNGGITNLIIDGTSAANTFNIAPGNGSPTMTLNGNNGNDVFLADLTHYTGFGAENPININGGAGTDGSSIFVRLGGVSSLTTTTVTGNGPTVNYATIEQLDQVGGPLSETFAMLSTAAGVNYQIFAGDGNDTIYFGGAFGQNYTLDGIDGPVTVRGEGGTDVMALLDTAQTQDRTYTINTLGATSAQMAEAGYDTTVEGISMTGGSGNDTLNVAITFATCPVTLNGGAGNDTLTVTGMASTGFVTVDGNSGLDTINVNNDNSGTARVLIRNTQDLAALNLFTGGTAVVEAGANAVIETKTLGWNNNSLLDLNDNDLILDYTGATLLSSIQSRINLARNGGAWNGTSGITSTSARNRNPKNTTLGALEGGVYTAMTGLTTFDGRTLDGTAVLIKYTYYGDTDFNDVVNFDDYSRADLGFNNHLTGWVNGDFDGNGIIDFDDYSLIDLAFNSQTGTLRPATVAPSKSSPSRAQI